MAATGNSVRAQTLSGGMSAPKVIAKGAGEIALKIREIGAENNVPMLQAPPLPLKNYFLKQVFQKVFFKRS